VAGGEHQPVALRAAFSELQVGPAGDPQALDRVIDADAGGVDGVAEVTKAVFDQSGEDRFAVGEVRVDRGCGKIIVAEALTVTQF
jgi:hypothetical protein